jgi:RNA polymerase-associated protein RTF1
LQRKKEEKAAAAAAAKTTEKASRRRSTKGKATSDKEKAIEGLKARRQKSKAREEEEEYVDPSSSEGEEEEEEEEADADGDYGDEKRSKSKRKTGRSSRHEPDFVDSDDAVDSGSGSDDEDESPADLEAVSKIRLSRHKLEHWCHETWFDELAEGCFVRIGIGQNKETGAHVYKCAMIVGVVDGSAHEFGKTRTRKKLVLKHGADEKPFRMCTVSNSAFTKGEFELWRAAMEESQTRVMGLKEAEAKFAEIEKSKYRERGYHDVAQILAQKRKAGSIAGNSGMRKQQLDHEIDVLEIERATLKDKDGEELDFDEREDRNRKIDSITAEITQRENEKELIAQAGEKRKEQLWTENTSSVTKINARNTGFNFSNAGAKALARNGRLRVVGDRCFWCLARMIHQPCPPACCDRLNGQITAHGAHCGVKVC